MRCLHFLTVQKIKVRMLFVIRETLNSSLNIRDTAIFIYTLSMADCSNSRQPLFYYLSIYRRSFLTPTLSLNPGDGFLGEAGDPNSQSPEGPPPSGILRPLQLFSLAGSYPSCQQEYDMAFMCPLHESVWSSYCVPDIVPGTRYKVDVVLICRYQSNL